MCLSYAQSRLRVASNLMSCCCEFECAIEPRLLDNRRRGVNWVRVRSTPTGTEEEISNVGKDQTDYCHRASPRRVFGSTGCSASRHPASCDDLQSRARVARVPLANIA